MAHTASCETAKRHECSCECGGSRHGWPYRLKLASNQSGAEREMFRSGVNQDWCDAADSQSANPSGDWKAAGTDAAVADIIDWLASNPATIAYAQSIGNVISEGIIPALEGQIGRVEWRAQKVGQLDHFWCDLLVGLVYAIDKFKQYWDRMPDYIGSQIVDSRAANGRTALPAETIDIAVRTAWKAFSELLQTDRLKEVLVAVRVLAILICKAPEEHRAVVQFCIVPLTNGIISPATKARLQEVLPSEWLSELRRSLVG